MQKIVQENHKLNTSHFYRQDNFDKHLKNHKLNIKLDNFIKVIAVAQPK